MTATEPAMLVTGMPRTGTSWVGKMLEASGEVVYVNEPLNPGHPPGHSPGVLDATVTHQFQYIDPEDDERLALPPSPVPSPCATASSASCGATTSRTTWLGWPSTGPASRSAGGAAGAPCWTTRSPSSAYRGWSARSGCVRWCWCATRCSLVGSYTKMNWQMRFDQLLDQPALLRDLIGPAVHDLHVAAKETDPVRSAAMMWRAIYGVVDRNYRGLPGVTIRRYEDLAPAPDRGVPRPV